MRPGETRDEACSEPTLRFLSDVLLQQIVRPNQTFVEKGVQKEEKPETQSVASVEWA